MKNLLDNIKLNIEQGNITNKCIYFYVMDTVGKFYYVKLNESIDAYLKRNYECCENDNWDLGIID